MKRLLLSFCSDTLSDSILHSTNSALHFSLSLLGGKNERYGDYMANALIHRENISSLYLVTASVTPSKFDRSL